ncbi:MAG: N-acetyltransferase [Phycisphaerae bacterium]
MGGNLSIAEIAQDDARGRREFLELPFDLYRSDPNWVPPHLSTQAKLFARKTAFAKHGKMGLFLARRDGRTVGRVAAIHNTAHNEYHKDRVGFFGFFECRLGDDEAANGLLSAAEEWLGARGLQSIRGPVNPSMNGTCGLLVEGFDSPPMAMMPYNPPYYPAMLEAMGLAKCKDLFAYIIRAEQVEPGSPVFDRLTKAADLIHRRYPDVSVRPINMRDYRREIVNFVAVFEAARRNNWGYVPVSEEDLMETVRDVKSVADPEIVLVAEVKGEPAGACLSIPNINRGLAACGGRMWPLGFLKYLWAMKRNTEMRIVAIAALERFRHQGITAMLFLETILRGLPLGYKTAEASWILEDNVMSNRTINQVLDAPKYKTYRIYEKQMGTGG